MYSFIVKIFCFSKNEIYLLFRNLETFFYTVISTSKNYFVYYMNCFGLFHMKVTTTTTTTTLSNCTRLNKVNSI